MNKRYYDSKLSDLENYNLEEVLPIVSNALVNTVSFLKERCYVLTYDLLPYRAQILAITWFFVKNQDTEGRKLDEMQRWFFYTTICNTFQNGSLTNIRRIHNRLEEFVEGRAETAYDYSEIELPKFDNIGGRASASSKLLVALHLFHYLHSDNHSSAPLYLGLYKPFGNIAVGNVPKFTTEDANLMMKIKQSSVVNLDAYGLFEKTIEAIKEGKKEDYLNERRLFIYDISKELLEDVGIRYRN